MHDHIVAELLDLVDPIIDRTKDQIGTHSDTCYEYHVGCLAFVIRARIAGLKSIHSRKPEEPK